MTQYTARREQGTKLTRDAAGKFLPNYTAKWAQAEQEKDVALSNRTFSAADVQLAAKYGADCEDLFL